jgi:hypothetical protein
VIASLGAGDKSNSNSHGLPRSACGSGEPDGDWYRTPAYYIIRAPRVPGTENRGAIRSHHAIMAWIRGPGMIRPPSFEQCFGQESNGENRRTWTCGHGHGLGICRFQ